MKATLRVWWNPQIPGDSFHYSVSSIKDGKLLLEVLALYDLFQLAHNIKPDYSNAGGVSWRHPTVSDGEWWDLDFEDDDNIAEVEALL